MSIFEWKSLTPQEIIMLAAILVALFGEKVWKKIEKGNKKKNIKNILIVPLDQLRKDLLRIRNVRNTWEGEGKRPSNTQISFSQTSFDEVKNYFYLFTDIVIPYIDYLDFPKDPKTIEFFTHYKCNIETLKSRIEKNGGWLTLGTVDNLLTRLNMAVKELSQQKC